uniref:Large ribosomal subunit protein uL22c n=1 Tax=Harveyella mirabilis TaxID=282355 RepID=A0A3S8UVY7_9FLOR|nr:hypothetical protein [Harveyella mirabilis]
MIYKKIQSHASGNYIKLSTHKSRKVLKQIQGKNYQEAKLILEFMPYKACKIIIKILKSALHNISQKNNNNINKNNLIIKEAFVNRGPIIKKSRFRARARTFSINKPTCHITIKVTT